MYVCISPHSITHAGFIYYYNKALNSFLNLYFIYTYNMLCFDIVCKNVHTYVCLCLYIFLFGFLFNNNHSCEKNNFNFRLQFEFHPVNKKIK